MHVEEPAPSVGIMLETPCRSGPSFPSPAQLFGQVAHSVPSLFPYGTSCISFASPSLF